MEAERARERASMERVILHSEYHIIIYSGNPKNPSSIHLIREPKTLSRLLHQGVSFLPSYPHSALSVCLSVTFLPSLPSILSSTFIPCPYISFPGNFYHTSPFRPFSYSVRVGWYGEPCNPKPPPPPPPPTSQTKCTESLKAGFDSGFGRDWNAG